jgi:hypothetical protein
MMKEVLLVALIVLAGAAIASSIKGEQLSFSTSFSICLATSCSDD